MPKTTKTQIDAAQLIVADVHAISDGHTANVKAHANKVKDKLGGLSQKQKDLQIVKDLVTKLKTLSEKGEKLAKAAATLLKDGKLLENEKDTTMTLEKFKTEVNTHAVGTGTCASYVHALTELGGKEADKDPKQKHTLAAFRFQDGMKDFITANSVDISAVVVQTDLVQKILARIAGNVQKLG